MHSGDLLSAFDRLTEPRLLVLGDFILDRYTWGDAERVSQEAPVILLRADKREVRLGGAGNVCAMLRGLDAHVVAAGVVGDDRDGNEIREHLTAAGVDPGLLRIDSTRPTTVKERFIGRAQGVHAHQILRVDSEVRDPLPSELESRLADDLIARLDSFDMVLISDYDKGVCTPRLLRRVIDACRRLDIPVLVDPIRGTDYARYRGATAMTPNRTEAGLATGRRIESAADALAAGTQLCLELDLQRCIVTLDKDGMALVSPDGTGDVHPTRPRAVYDITGAGDMVLAMIGVALASGLSYPEAVQLGNVAGGLEVEKVGVAVIPRAEIQAWLVNERRSRRGKRVELDELAEFITAHRAAGQSIVFTNGCFDLLHVGHVRCLQESAAQGDVLIVALNSDASVRRLKGPTRPVINELDRAALVAALDCVDYVLTFDDDTPLALIERLQPDVLVKGGTYQVRDVVGHDVVARYGGRVHLADMVPGVSTSTIVRTLNASPDDARRSAA